MLQHACAAYVALLTFVLHRVAAVAEAVGQLLWQCIMLGGYAPGSNQSYADSLSYQNQQDSGFILA